MKKYIIIIILMLATTCFADTLQIPFSVYPKKIQREFKKIEVRLDLNPNDRTERSWGFLENKGTSFNIITYKPVNAEDFPVIQEIIFHSQKE